MQSIWRRVAVLILFACFCVLSAGPALAASSRHVQAAEQLLETIHIDQLLEGSMDSMLQLQFKNNPGLQPFEATFREFFKKYMSAESLHDEFIALYTETFSETELQELDSFYATPTGQKSLQVSPQLLARGAAIGQQRVQENLPELQRMIAADLAKLQQQEEKSE